MKRGETERFETTVFGGESVRAFVPHPLPPHPPLVIDGALQQLLERAVLALGRLDSLTSLLPNTAVFLYMYVRKEAVLSSQIEGTQSSLSDLLLFELEEAPGTPMNDVVEVSNYVAALHHGLGRLREGLPLCNRLIREIHGVLLAQGRGSDKAPGEFRRSQNWIGGTRPGNASFVPPPAETVADCMSDFERFLHDNDNGLPVIVKAAVAHVQFETIHPFLDGNGRVGRLLIPFLLNHGGVLSEPMLYLSLYLKQRRDEYYALLDYVRQKGDWEAWLAFFLEGVRETAEGAVTTARQLMVLFQKDQVDIQGKGRAAGSALRVHQALQSRPIMSISQASKETGLSFPPTSDAMSLLEELGIVHELTGKKRFRVFAYDRYLDILNKGTEAL